MKLATFEKVHIGRITEYEVFSWGDFIERFVVEYPREPVGRVTKDLEMALLKRMSYENRGAKVVFVGVNDETGNLTVTIEI